MRKNNRKSQSNPNTTLPHLTTLLPQTSEQLRQSQAECRRLEGELALSQLALSTATASASTAQVYSIYETQRQRYIQRQIKGQEMVSRRGADLGLVSIPPRHRSWRNSKRLPWGKQTPVASCRAATKHWWDNLGGIPNNECEHECFSGKVNLTQLFHLTEILEYQAQSEQFDNWRLLLWNGLSKKIPKKIAVLMC